MLMRRALPMMEISSTVASNCLRNRSGTSRPVTRPHPLFGAHHARTRHTPSPSKRSAAPSRRSPSAHARPDAQPTLPAGAVGVLLAAGVLAHGLGVRPGPSRRARHCPPIRPGHATPPSPSSASKHPPPTAPWPGSKPCARPPLPAGPASPTQPGSGPARSDSRRSVPPGCLVSRVPPQPPAIARTNPRTPEGLAGPSALGAMAGR